jgi:GNAT superfamily N-acetyltransferase
MQIEIYKSYETVSSYIDTVSKCADKFKKELGFLPHLAYEEQAIKGRLWVAVSGAEKHFAGHLMFGGRFPALKVTQMFVHPDYRGRGIATILIEDLATYGEENNYLSIAARVAEDLPANIFWENSGFELIQKKKGGKTTQRIINVRCRELNTPSLLTLMANAPPQMGSHEKISYKNKPISSTPFYAIDLNILFDIVKDRASRAEASAVIMAGFNNIIRLCVTEEFVKELERNTRNGETDPLLELAKALPTLKAIEISKVNELMPLLRQMVFPERKLDGRTSQQDHSDLLHLANAICSGADGFITREKAILRAGKEIYDGLSLEVIPPADFLDSSFEEESKKTTIFERFSNSQIDFFSIEEKDLVELNHFLRNININEHFDSAIWSPVTSGSSSRKWCVRVDNILVGVASWTPPNKVVKSASLHLFVDEEQPSFTKIVDHIFETIFQDANGLDMFRVALNIGSGQVQTKALALQRGFRAGVRNNGLRMVDALVKTVCSGIVKPDDWGPFAEKFQTLTGLSLPTKMPAYRDETTPWIIAEDKTKKQKCEMSLFEFETLVSPAVFLCPRRSGLIIPIQHKYAVDLGIVVPSQMGLLPGSEALLHPEKAYFRTSVCVDKYSKGMPIVFYVSGSGEMSQNAVGCARITYSGVHSVNEAENKFSRQGVLTREKLEEMADDKGKVHVFTFDNFNRFTSRVPFQALRSSDQINAANLIAAESKTADQMRQIVSLALN